MAATIWLDRNEKNPDRRYKMFNVERRPTDRRWQFILKYSPDGIHWSDGVAQSGDLYDRSSVFYNPFRDVWCLSMRYGTKVSSRSRSYLEAKDPETAVSMAHRVRKGVPDKNVVFWFTPDDKEPRHPRFPEVHPGIYNFDVIPYESIMLGQYAVWQGPENNICGELGIQKRNEICLGYSRDGGYSWQRDDMSPFIAIDDAAGSWRGGNLQSSIGSPLIVGDELYFYFSARRMENKVEITTTGLARLRRDGFASLSGTGITVTNPLLLNGSTLWVNARIGGSLKVEVLDSKGTVLTDHTTTLTASDGCALKVCDGLDTTVRSKAVSLRFTADDCDIYAFWVGGTDGRSGGYTAGGGPGLHPSGTDK